MSAAERRRARNAALVAQHPAWRGIHHPELIAFPPRRFSQVDMLSALEHARAWPRPRDGPGTRDAHSRRAERMRDVVARHPRWRGIVHPERIFFPESGLESEPLLSYRGAVCRALEGVHRSEDLCERIAAVADALDRRSWPWAASPTMTSAAAPPASQPRRRLPRLPGIRRGWAHPAFPYVRPTGGLLPH